MRRALTAAAAGALAVLGPLACAGGVAGQELGHGGGPALDPIPLQTRGVSVTDHGVIPRVTVVAPGTEVTWRNDGRSVHTVTEVDGRWESGGLFHGQRFTIRAPAATGSYAYYCRFHSTIRGVLVVSPLDLEGPASVAYRTRAGLAGTMPGAAPGTAITIERRVAGRWAPVADATTDPEGAFGASTPPLQAGGAFRAVSGDAISPSVRIGVEPLVAVTLRGRVLRARVHPGRKGARVVLERLDLETYRWRPAGRGRLSSSRTAGLRMGAPGVYRARVPHAGPGLVEGVSAPAEYRADGYRDR
jgi:plastocyanin